MDYVHLLQSGRELARSNDNFTCKSAISNWSVSTEIYNSEGEYDSSNFRSLRDSDSHGTHTASTAGGNVVEGTSYYGLAAGETRGGLPSARIAVYKVCWHGACSFEDILPAFDDAIADGVDIISVSLGSDVPDPYFKDPIAIGSFHAMKKVILSSNSAGNSGPFPRTISNVSPWSLTVAASSIDRKFVSQVVLGNGQIFTGAINSFALNGTSYPLIWGGDAANVSAGANTASFCGRGRLNSHKTEGKSVLCNGFFDGSGVLAANGIGVVMVDYVDDFAFPFPAYYMHPVATILVGETWKDAMAPVVASSSSRGYNLITPDILKPDITAPGVDILAAWSPVAAPSLYDEDTRSVNYNIISGTSMSCPHASGAAAYVKAAHPAWSPAAIKSAIMTTAQVMDGRKHEDKEFAYGSGHINPLKAVALDWYLMQMRMWNSSASRVISYNTSTLRLVTGDSSVCNNTTPGKAWGLNYPSFALAIED